MHNIEGISGQIKNIVSFVELPNEKEIDDAHIQDLIKACQPDLLLDHDELTIKAREIIDQSDLENERESKEESTKKLLLPSNLKNDR